MCLEKQPYKNQNMKTPLQHYKYNADNVISSFKQAKMVHNLPINKTLWVPNAIIVAFYIKDQMPL